MKLTSLARTISAVAAFSLVAPMIASASTIHHGVAGPSAHKYQLVNAAQRGVRSDLTCPPTYFECVSVTASSPFSAGWCVSTTGNCSSGLVGLWEWTASVTNTKNGKASKKIKATWSPDPGNPSTVTFTTKKKKAKGKKIAFAVALSACEVTSGTCFTDFETYGVTN